MNTICLFVFALWFPKRTARTPIFKRRPSCSLKSFQPANVTPIVTATQKNWLNHRHVRDFSNDDVLRKTNRSKIITVWGHQIEQSDVNTQCNYCLYWNTNAYVTFWYLTEVFLIFDVAYLWLNQFCILHDLDQSETVKSF